MEHYNQLYLQQLSPLIWIKLNELDSDVSTILAECFNQFRVNARYWDNSIIKNRILNPKYIIKLTEGSTRVTGKEVKNLDEDYSILSPFNKDSDLFPNGILSEKWFKKYIENRPFAIVITFKFPNTEEEFDRVSNELSDLKLYYSKMNIHFISLIISNNDDNGNDEHTVTQLRSLTGLARGTGLIYLNSSSVNFHRDLQVAVTSIFSSLKPFATDFYGKIENRIKQRYKKYYTYPSGAINDTVIKITPKFLETRNIIKQAIIRQFILPNNLTSSIKLLESGYQNLVVILKENFRSFSPQFLERDLVLYKQIRELLDILAFHIVRGYISIEDPLTALKKHKVHIDNVLDALGNPASHNKWISIQYQWLGDFLCSIPSILLLNVAKGKNVEKDVQLMRFSGGLHYSNGFEVDIFTNPGQVYLQAYFYQKKALLKNETDQYMEKESDSFENSLKLLDKAIEFFNSADLQNFVIDEKQRLSISFYLKFLKAEDLFTNKISIKESSALYLELLNEINLINWPNCLFFILQRLMICSLETNDYEELLFCIVNASIIAKDNCQLDLPKSRISFDHFKSLNFDSSHFFDINGYLISPAEAAYPIDENDFIIQLILSRNINIDILKKLLPEGVTVLLKINKITVNVVSYSNEKKSLAPEDFFNIAIEHDDNLPISEFESIKNSGSGVNTKANLTPSTFKILHILKLNNSYVNAKLLSMQKIEIESVILLEKAGQQIEIQNKFKKEFDLKSNNRSIIDVYSPSFDESGKLISGNMKPVRIKNRFPHTLQIVPLKPLIEVIPIFPSKILIGEKVAIPCDIKFINIEKFTNKSALLSTKTSIVDSNITQEVISNISTKENWQNLKDDIPLELKILEENAILELVVLVSPHYASQLSDKILVNILFQVFVLDHDDHENIENSVSYEIYSCSLPVENREE